MSEDFPRPQDQNNTESMDSGATGSAVNDGSTTESSHPPAPSHQPDRLKQPYPAAHYNTGEYRHHDNPAVVVPAAEIAAQVTAAGSRDAQTAVTGPLTHQLSPGQPSPTGWQPRSGDALPAQSWTPNSITGNSSDDADHYGSGAYGPPNPWAPTGHSAPGQLFSRAQPTGQFGDPRYAGDGQDGGFGHTWTPTATGLAAPSGAGTTTTSTSRKDRKTVLVVAAAVVLALGAGFGAGVAGAHAGNSAPVVDSSLNHQTSSPVVADSQLVPAGSVEAVAAKLLPSVVSILSISATQQAEGSGVILSSAGLILTNNHVIAGATTLTVKFNDGTTATAKVVGADATDDLAVIKVSGVSGLTVATLGSSANLKVGEQVVAVGSPLGLSATVTSGILSALDRPVRTAAEPPPSQPQSQGQLGQGQQNPTRPTQTQSSNTAQSTVLNAIQTDAAINPGNSGGPLVDMNGAVIGINSAIASLSSGNSSSQSGSIGVGFAIPIDQAHRIAQQIINTGHATHAVLGASVGDAANGTSPAAQAQAQAGLSVGAKIASVTGGAAAAGLTTGDVITKVGDTPVGSADSLIATIRSSTPGSKVVVTYQRGTATKTATVTLGSAVSN
jgi:putative serine protease PepD